MNDERKVCFDAIRNGDVQSVRAFVDSHPDLKEWHFLGTCLACAAAAGQLAVGEYLADVGARVETNDVAMRAAVCAGHVDFASFLRQRGCELSVRVIQENDLFHAIHHGHKDVARWLANGQIDPNLLYETVDGEQVNALSYAQSLQKAEIVMLLKSLGCRKPRKWFWKDTPQKEYDYLRSEKSQLAHDIRKQCYDAAHYHDVDTFEVLLQQSPRLKDDLRFVNGIASIASRTGQLRLMQLLEAELQQPEILIGERPIERALNDASYHGYLPIVEYLLSIGADANFFPKHSSGLISEAIFNGHLAVAKSLHKHGATFSTDDFQKNPMIHAITDGREDIAGWLLSTDFDPHVAFRGTEGGLFNSLTYAVRCEKTTIAEALEAAGCKPPVEGVDLPVRDYSLDEE